MLRSLRRNCSGSTALYPPGALSSGAAAFLPGSFQPISRLSIGTPRHAVSQGPGSLREQATGEDRTNLEGPRWEGARWEGARLEGPRLEGPRTWERPRRAHPLPGPPAAALTAD